MNAEKQKFLTENFYGYETNETGESVWLFKESELVELMDKWKSVVCKKQVNNCIASATIKQIYGRSITQIILPDQLERLLENIKSAPEPEI